MATRIRFLSATLLLVLPFAFPASSAGKNRLPPEKSDVAGALNSAFLKTLRARFKLDPALKRLADAVVGNNLKNIALNHDVIRNDNPYFSHEIKRGKITNQAGSGRCWMFAGLNVLRPAVVKKLNWNEFEFSEAYLFFWDKLEKANMFLERVIRRRNLDERDLRYQRLLKEFIDDGGWWEEFVYLVKKYGVVPKSAMPETKATSGSGAMNRRLRDRLVRCAAEIHRAARKGKPPAELRKIKEKCLGDIYRILAFHLGTPPEKFTFRYKAKKKGIEKLAALLKLYEAVAKSLGKEDFTESEAFKKLLEEKVSPIKTYTPRAFADEFVIPDLDRYVTLANIPARPYDKTYVCRLTKTMVEAEDIRFLNVPIEDMKAAVLQSVLADDPVWFGADVGRQVDSSNGIMHPDLYRYADIYGVDFALDKGTRIIYGAVVPNHAMVFQGVDYVDGKVVKWLVENSWGENRGRKGMYTMYDGWFDEYVLMAVVDKKYLPPRLVKLLGKKPVVIKEEDPIGRLFRSRPVP